MLKDAVFGDIEWTGDEWTTDVQLPYFRGFGDRIHLTKEEREELGPEGELKLTIGTGGKRKRPTEAHRVAWEKILQREDAMWKEVMDALVAEYQLQRPTRVRYWTVLRGSRLLDKSLPAVVDRSIMQQLVRPLWIGVHPPDEEHRTVDVYLSFLATWWSEGINVYIRDGRVTEVTAMGFMHNRKLPWIETSAFGTLRRRPGVREQSWAGETVLEAFRSFAATAIDRSVWDEAYTRKKTPESDLPWDIARGSASLWVYTESGRPPTAKQASGFEAFREAQDAHALAVISAIFEHYRKTFKARRAAYLKRGDPSLPDVSGSAKTNQKDGGVPERMIKALFEWVLDTSPGHKLTPAQRRALSGKAIPAINDANGLRNLTELTDVNIFPDRGSDPVKIGLVFSGPWIGDAGLGVRWRDGKVEEVGPKRVALP